MDMTNLNQAASNLKGLLDKEAKAWLDGNREALVTFTEDQVKAIFEDVVFEHIAIPDLPPNASADAAADREELCLRKDQAAQLFAAAKLKHAELSAELRSKAIGVLAKVAGGVAGLGLTLLKGVV